MVTKNKKDCELKFKIGDKVKAIYNTIHKNNSDITYGIVEKTRIHYDNKLQGYVQLITLNDVFKNNDKYTNHYLCSSYDFELIEPIYEIW